MVRSLQKVYFDIFLDQAPEYMLWRNGLVLPLHDSKHICNWTLLYIVLHGSLVFVYMLRKSQMYPIVNVVYENTMHDKYWNLQWCWNVLQMHSIIISKCVLSPYTTFTCTTFSIKVHRSTDAKIRFLAIPLAVFCSISAITVLNFHEGRTCSFWIGFSIAYSWN